MRESFRNYLIQMGYKEYTPSGNPSTVYSYLISIERVCDWENLNWYSLKNNIASIIREYDQGGAKEHLGNKSNKTIINALRRYQEFCKTH